MQCPYCISDINDAAVVCTTCQRDLVLVKPLQLRLADLEKRLQDLDPARNAALVARVAELEGKLDPRKIVAPEAVDGPEPEKRSAIKALMTALARIECPYCTTNIKAAAVVCPTCQRDLFLVKPLQQKLASLKTKLQDSGPERQAELVARVAELEGKLTQQEMAPSHSAEAQKSAEQRAYLLSALIAALVSLALLLAAHWVIVIHFDLKTIYLRIASLLIPLPFGFALYMRYPHRFWHSSLMALLVACCAVLGMSAVTGYVDKVPVLPENAREWREFFEYAASITLSFVTGLFLGKLRYQKTQEPAQPGRLAVHVAKLIAKDEDGESGAKKLVANVTGISSVAAPVVSGAVSVYSGIKAVIGG